MKIYRYILPGIMLVVLLIAMAIFIPGKINDINLVSFENNVIKNLTMPEKTEVIEYVSGCGNSSGTGDHTDLYVAVLIKSELTFDELATYYSEDEYFWRMKSVENQGNGTIGMKCMDLQFNADTKTGRDYYILEYNKEGVLDWRGW